MKIAIAEEDDAIEQVLCGGEPLQEWTILKLSNSDALRGALTDPDLRVLIIDWTNPRLADPNLCRRIRLRDATEPYVYLIAVVGPNSAQARLGAYEAGVDAVVEMQTDSRQILARLDVARRIVDHEAALRNRSDGLEQARLLLEAENAALSEIASSDGLTGLRNRRFFREALDAQFSLARRKGLPISLVMIDVDQFKAFNDRFGHPAGDDVLREVGMLLRSSVRDHDIVARYGGEEFAILLPATEMDECFPWSTACASGSPVTPGRSDRSRSAWESPLWACSRPNLRSWWTRPTVPSTSRKPSDGTASPAHATFLSFHAAPSVGCLTRNRSTFTPSRSHNSCSGHHRRASQSEPRFAAGCSATLRSESRTKPNTAPPLIIPIRYTPTTSTEVGAVIPQLRNLTGINVLFCNAKIPTAPRKSSSNVAWISRMIKPFETLR